MTHVAWSRDAVASCAAIAFLSCAASAWAATAAPLPPAADLSLAHDIYKELVELNTTHEHGSTIAAQAIQRHLLAAGFPANDVVFIAPADRPGKGNVIIRYHGKGFGRPVLFLGHLDVVDAKPDDWSVDPFKLTEKDGWFYGRGTIDMKDGDAALLETLIRLRREHYVPDRDVIAAFTADEEAGGDANGPAFLLKEHRNLIDAGLVINLDGRGGDYKNGQRHVFTVDTSQKTYVTYTLETTSSGGHGSLPGPDNAIYRLAKGLVRLDAHNFPLMLTATTRASFKKFADLDLSPQSADMRAVANDPPDLEAAERLSQIVRLNAQLRTTCVATLISGGHAENALPQRAKATIQCRMMPGDTAEHVQSELTSTLDDAKIRMILDAPPIVSRESPPDRKFFARMTRVVDSMWPGVSVVPTMATGFSDARQTTNAGMPTYDLAGRWMDQDENRAHGRDERLGVREFDESVEYTYRLVKEMSRRE